MPPLPKDTLGAEPTYEIANARFPLIKWAQRADCIYITIMISNEKKKKLEIDE